MAGLGQQRRAAAAGRQQHGQQLPVAGRPQVLAAVGLRRRDVSQNQRQDAQRRLVAARLQGQQMTSVFHNHLADLSSYCRIQARSTNAAHLRSKQQTERSSLRSEQKRQMHRTGGSNGQQHVREPACVRQSPDS